MYIESSLKERCQKILEENGGRIADRASRILLEDPILKDLRPPLEFISKNWREPLTPSMMSLACEAVGGSSKETHETSLAMSLMHLCFYVWDDMVDKANFKSFKPTLFGKFGEGTALVIGGLASAKAFSILNQMNMNEKKRKAVTKLVWDLWAKMAMAETIKLRLRSQENLSSEKKFWIIKMEAIDLETCLSIGAVLGNGSEAEVKNLGRYGLYLGIILELLKDFLVSVNLTLELAGKIRSGALPYSLLWAKERSDKIRKKLELLANEDTIEPSDIKEIVKSNFETKALNNTLEIVKRFTKKGKAELSKLTKNNRTTQTLKFFVEAQPQLLIEDLRTFQL